MAVPLKLEGVSIRYGAKTVVDRVSFELAAARIGCLLGPSGCGKTTLLRAIAGFEPLCAGMISLDQRVISQPGDTLVPELRRVGMVFQEFALFPHLRVADNIGFGLRRMAPARRNQRVTELLQMIGLGDAGRRYPHELSGGQQQRVALARAIAPRPDLLLLDEPFSSLDVELRAQLALEVRALLRREQITALLVTHDQQEAFAFADGIGVLEHGHLQQWGTPQALYEQPQTQFVANFIGEGCLLDAQVSNDVVQCSLGELPRLKGGSAEPLSPENSETRQKVLIRPNDVIYDAQSHLHLRVLQRVWRGADCMYTLLTPTGERLCCKTDAVVLVEPDELLPIRVIPRQWTLLAADEDGKVCFHGENSNGASLPKSARSAPVGDTVP
ncbi:ABC-type Fe3+ transport system, ATP-binding protein [gamma proteobacterium HdN1]|nr:ABC-type Fe3+ transport system, ATP-binding protein [gamma proteobacterium HdN1]